MGELILAAAWPYQRGRRSVYRERYSPSLIHFLNWF